MAATWISFLILSATLDIIVSAQTRSFNISRGSSLTPTNQSSWLSPSGLYAFGFYPQHNGYRVGITITKIQEKTVVWTAFRENPTFNGNSTLLLTNDGRLIVKPLEGNGTTIIETPNPIYSASMLDSGNFVLYNSSQEMIWQSFDNPTDTILPGQSLKEGKELVSSASSNDYSPGNFVLRMQTDGNLVQYPVKIIVSLTPSDAYWASGTNGLGDNISLNLDETGNLRLFNSSVILKNITENVSPKEDAIILMRIDVDGIFRTYSHTLNQKGNWSVQWASSRDRCVPKGTCGLNSYCISTNEKIDCRCLPGFDFVNLGNWSSGCERNFTVERCKNENEITEYTMTNLDNTFWDEVSYSELSSTKEDCKKACLEDCNCEVALFNDGNCKKQKLPMRYGRIDSRNSNIALIKVDSSAPALNLHPPKEKKEKTRTDILIIGFALVAFSIFLLTISGIFIYNSRVWAFRKIFEHENVELGKDVSLRAFTFAEVEQITNGFKEELGRGAFGTVYKGVISHHQQVVAVKKLERALADGEREFQTEIKAIGRTHHRNLVRLIGYCLEGLNRILVYEYMSNGSLADFLFRPENRPSWDDRIAIALDIAKGILYLHEECETQIIHCDIKPQNILMDEHIRAKICDFGLAKLLKPDQTKTYTGIRGTRGYVAPEWHKKLPITVKADIYSFGIVFFEIICSRRSIDWSLSEEEAVLEEWVYDCFEAKEVMKLVGDEDVNVSKLERMVKVGLWCIQDEPSLRPSMKKVVLMLEGTVEIPVPPSPTSFLSTM